MKDDLDKEVEEEAAGEEKEAEEEEAAGEEAEEEEAVEKENQHRRSSRQIHPPRQSVEEGYVNFIHQDKQVTRSPPSPTPGRRRGRRCGSSSKIRTFSNGSTYNR